MISSVEKDFSKELGDLINFFIGLLVDNQTAIDLSNCQG